MSSLTRLSDILPGDYQHHWSSFIWEAFRTFVGLKRVIKVHLYRQFFDFCVCLHTCDCTVLYNTARELPVSTVLLDKLMGQNAKLFECLYQAHI
jgi:hypothetical protein